MTRSLVKYRSQEHVCEILTEMGSAPSRTQVKKIALSPNDAEPSTSNAWRHVDQRGVNEQLSMPESRHQEEAEEKAKTEVDSLPGSGPSGHDSAAAQVEALQLEISTLRSELASASAQTKLKAEQIATAREKEQVNLVY